MPEKADVLLATVTQVESLAVPAAFEPVTGQPARLEMHGDTAIVVKGDVHGGIHLG